MPNSEPSRPQVPAAEPLGGNRFNPDLPPPAPDAVPAHQRPRRWGVCRRCGRNCTIYRRGLCTRCYKDPAVRPLFPSQFAGGYALPAIADRCNPGRGPARAARRRALAPTDAPPGSEAKVAVMEERALLGLPLFLEGDAKKPWWEDDADACAGRNHRKSAGPKAVREGA